MIHRGQERSKAQPRFPNEIHRCSASFRGSGSGSLSRDDDRPNLSSFVVRNHLEILDILINSPSRCPPTTLFPGIDMIVAAGSNRSKTPPSVCKINAFYRGNKQFPFSAEVDCTRGIPPISPTGEKLSLYFPPFPRGRSSLALPFVRNNAEWLAIPPEKFHIFNKKKKKKRKEKKKRNVRLNDHCAFCDISAESAAENAKKGGYIKNIVQKFYVLDALFNFTRIVTI